MADNNDIKKSASSLEETKINPAVSGDTRPEVRPAIKAPQNSISAQAKRKSAAPAAVPAANNDEGEGDWVKYAIIALAIIGLLIVLAFLAGGAVKVFQVLRVLINMLPLIEI